MNSKSTLKTNHLVCAQGFREFVGNIYHYRSHVEEVPYIKDINVYCIFANLKKKTKIYNFPF